MGVEDDAAVTSYQQPTLGDVARRAEVSLATASRVLNGSGGRAVGEELRQRVLAATQELGYIPNAHAQALAGASTTTVGVITHDISDPYFSAIAQGTMRAAAEHGSLVMLASTFRDPEREIAHVSALRVQRARAILLIGSGFESAEYARAMRAEIDPYRSSGGRVAVVSSHDLDVDAVLPDNRGGAAEMARALYELGHRELAVITGPAQLTTVAHRFAGFRDALARLGVTIPERNIVDGAFTRDGGYAATVELVRRGLSASAIFCLNDVMAVGASTALREHGVSVPDDVSIAGFDDIAIAGDLSPALTTFRLPLARIGARVLELALDDRSGSPRTENVGGDVVLRGSAAAPRSLGAGEAVSPEPRHR